MSITFQHESNVLSLLTELEKLFVYRMMLKHLQGQHDQSAHAGGGGKFGRLPSGQTHFLAMVKPDVATDAKLARDRQIYDFKKKFAISDAEFNVAAKDFGEDWDEAITNTYSFESGDLKTSITELSVYDGYDEAELSLDGHVYDKEGNKVGNFTRTLTPYSVHHDLFELSTSVQGTGFGSEFYQHVEEEYLNMGIESIDLQANLSVGGYAWARMGFDFQDDYVREGIVENFRSEYVERYGPRGEDYDDEDDYDFDLEYAADDSGITYDSAAWDIASFVGPDGHKLGKEIMLGSNWNAVKQLGYGDGYEVGEAYYAAKKKSKKGKKLKQVEDTQVEKSDRNGFWDVNGADDDAWLKAMQKLKKKRKPGTRKLADELRKQHAKRNGVLRKRI